MRSTSLVSVHAIDDDEGGGDGFLFYPSDQLVTKSLLMTLTIVRLFFLCYISGRYCN